MHLTRLELRHFRNLGVQELRIPPEGVAVVGANAQGKTNLLEAIYYLEIFRSFRGSRDAQLVAFEEDVFRVVGRLEGGPDGKEEREVTAAYARAGSRKKITVDGAEAERVSDAVGRLGAVIFSPDDVTIVSGGPSERRRYLDILLSLNAGGYLSALQEYRKALSQRNAALREEAPSAAVRAWDDAVVRSGGTVMAERQGWLRERRESFEGYYGAVSGGATASFRYDPSVELDGARDPEAMGDAFRDALARTADRERRVGNTVVGPHRDEVFLTLEGDDEERAVRDFGSAGQRRTAALALRLVEAETIRESRGEEPLVLLDDVFAELDRERGGRILEFVDGDEMGQVILTAPKASDVRVRADVLPRWRIEDGRIET